MSAAAIMAGTIAVSGLIAVQPSHAGSGAYVARSASTDFSAAKKKHTSRNNPNAAYGSIADGPVYGGPVYTSPSYGNPSYGYSGGYGYGYGDNSRNQTW